MSERWMKHNLGGVVEGDECRAHNKHSICDSSPPHGQSDMVTRSPLEILDLLDHLSQGPTIVQTSVSDTSDVITAAVRMMAQITHLLVHVHVRIVQVPSRI